MAHRNCACGLLDVTQQLEALGRRLLEHALDDRIGLAAAGHVRRPWPQSRRRMSSPTFL
jgi:hypothetical protein